MKKTIIIFIFFILTIENAFSLIKVDITRGNLDPLPIAVSPLHIDNKSDDFKSLKEKKLGEEISKIIGLKIHLKPKDLIKALKKTIEVNKMKSDVHLRIIISRGIKSTPYQSPEVTISKPTIIIIPEYKKPNKLVYQKGLKLVTVNIIRGPKNVQDPQINSLSKLNCILACIEASKKGGEEALMFDINGNISTNNSTHFFYIKKNIVYTSTGKFCVTGITRNKIIKPIFIVNIRIIISIKLLKSIGIGVMIRMVSKLSKS